MFKTYCTAERHSYRMNATVADTIIPHIHVCRTMVQNLAKCQVVCCGWSACLEHVSISVTFGEYKCTLLNVNRICSVFEKINVYVY